jgi:long-chain acyl-CoA synthetase
VASDTIVHRLLAQRDRRPSAPAYFVKHHGVWRPTSWRDYVVEIRTAARALMALGLPAGGTVAMLGFNRPEWVIFDHAAMMAGGAPAGIYTTCSAEEVQYIVDHAEAHVVLIEDVGQWKKLVAERAGCPSLRHVVTMRDCPPIDDPLVLSWAAFCDRRRRSATPSSTRGSIGHRAGAAGDVDLHLGHHRPAQGRDAVARQPGVDGARADRSGRRPRGRLRPVVPAAVAHRRADVRRSTARHLGRDGVLRRVDRARCPTTSRRCSRRWSSACRASGRSSTPASPPSWPRPPASRPSSWRGPGGCRGEVTALRNRGKEPGGALALQYKLADRLVLSKLKPALGLGRARLCVTGAAPLATDVLEFFATLDLVLHEVYGQSEDSGPTSFNLPGATRLGTVGRPLAGVEVKLADDGEILVRGPNVFLGYFKEPAATAEALDGGGCARVTSARSTPTATCRSPAARRRS